MKNLKYITLFICSLCFFCACDKETEGISSLLHFELNGDETMLVTLNTSYEEPGFKITLDGADVSESVEIKHDVDPNRVGLYTVQYIYTNMDGIKTVKERTVIVNDPTVTLDMAGSYITANGTQREYNGTTPFQGQKISIGKIAPGFFSISDFLGGWYAQRAGYGAAYACSGYVQLLNDGSFELLSSSLLPWADTIDGIIEGKYDATTGQVSWKTSYAGMGFTIVLNK